MNRSYLNLKQKEKELKLINPFLNEPFINTDKPIIHPKHVSKYMYNQNKTQKEREHYYM